VGVELRPVALDEAAVGILIALSGRLEELVFKHRWWSHHQEGRPVGARKLIGLTDESPLARQSYG
jgi:hypothetical protein